MSASIAEHCAFVEKFSCTKRVQPAPFLAFQSSFNACATVLAILAPKRLEPASVRHSSSSSTSTPCSGFTNSTGPPLFAPMVGQPQAMHSTKTMPKGSFQEGKSPTSDIEKSSANMGWPLGPTKKVRWRLSFLAKPSYSAIASLGPLPTMTVPTSGNFFSYSAAAWSTASRRFQSANLPTKVTIFFTPASFGLSSSRMCFARSFATVEPVGRKVFWFTPICE
mmetsp:Transcript_28480/g.90761  ORF Transcript_28480/g.90761 Transcript_28480/m.90761 type:complete len:222 (-) Transcript_28480:833-1498(-)